MFSFSSSWIKVVLANSKFQFCWCYKKQMPKLKKFECMEKLVLKQRYKMNLNCGCFLYSSYLCFLLGFSLLERTNALIFSIWKMPALKLNQVGFNIITPDFIKATWHSSKFNPS